MGGVKQEPINDVDLPLVLLKAHLEWVILQLLVKDYL